MKLKNLLLNKLLRSRSGKLARNFLNIKKTNLLLDYTKKNVSVSDAFFWRVDKYFYTIFKFNNILKFFYKDELSDIRIFFYDHKFNLIKEAKIISTKANNKIDIDQTFLGLKEGYGSFYIFHSTNKNLNSIVRNSCYTGFSYKDSIPSYVHGNLQAASKNYNKNKIEFGLGAKSFLINNRYIVQNEMDYDKTEIILINNCNSKLSFYHNSKKINLEKGHTKILNLDDTKIVSLKSNSYLLRPIIFNYKKDYLDVYHG